MKCIDQASIVKATIRTSHMTLEEAKRFFRQWQDADGIVFLSVLVKKQKIRVHYDARSVQLNDILDGVKASNINENVGWLSRWRLQIIRQIEQNVIDNIRHVPHCCAKAPKLK